nr:2'-5' RNA ligase family protein [Propioniciclava soli]
MEPWVAWRTAQYDAAWVSDDPAFAHAHVTVLAPFPVDRTDVAARVARGVPPFSYRLARIGVFPDGVIHAVPEPADGFRALTDACRAALPDVAPYWGRVPDPTPHVTLDRVGEGVSAASTRALLGAALPASCRADSLVLTWWEAGACRVLERFELGRWAH